MQPVFRVDRERWRAAHPVTFLTAPAGVRRVEMRIQSKGEVVAAQMDIDVYSGQWRQLAVGQGRYPPPVFDERGVNVNTVTMPSCRRVAMRGLLVLLVMVVASVATCLFGPHLLDLL